MGGRISARAERLRGSREIQRVLEKGGRFRAQGLQISVTEVQEGGATRAGFIVKRKIGSAYVRNLMKRRMREAYRRYGNQLRPGLNIVVSAQAVLDYHELREKMEELFHRCGALSRDEQKI